MTSQDLEGSDKVSWSSTHGKATGYVKKKLTAQMDIKTHHAGASPGNPQLLVESSSFAKVAACKPAALRKVKAK